MRRALTRRASRQKRIIRLKYDYNITRAKSQDGRGGLRRAKKRKGTAHSSRGITHTCDMERKNIGAIILAGGRGMRLRPLTGNMPKPMVPILDKPVLQLIVSRLVKAGITDIAMTLGYMPERITGYFGNGSKLGARLTYFVERAPLGTAGGVKNAEKFIDGPFVVMSGDALTNIDIKALVERHKDMSHPERHLPHPAESNLQGKLLWQGCHHVPDDYQREGD